MSHDSDISRRMEFSTVYSAFFDAPLVAENDIPDKDNNSGARKTVVRSPDGKTVILCREPAWRSAADMVSEDAILRILDESRSLDFALPLLHRAPTDKNGGGRPFWQDAEGAIWSARDYLGGESFDWRKMTWQAGHCYLGGRALAQIHSLSRVGGIEQALFAHARADFDYLAMARERLTAVGARPELVKLVDALRRTDTAGNHPVLAGGRDVLMHGDLHPGNIVYAINADEIAGVIDWDFSRRGSQLMDFCMAREMFAGEFRKPEQIPVTAKVERQICGEFRRAFTRGYKTTVMPLLKVAELYPEGVTSYDEQLLPERRTSMESVDEEALSAPVMVARLLIYCFEREQLDVLAKASQSAIVENQIDINQIDKNRIARKQIENICLRLEEILLNGK